MAAAVLLVARWPAVRRGRGPLGFRQLPCALFVVGCASLQCIRVASNVPRCWRHWGGAPSDRRGNDRVCLRGITLKLITSRSRSIRIRCVLIVLAEYRIIADKDLIYLIDNRGFILYVYNSRRNILRFLKIYYILPKSINCTTSFLKCIYWYIRCSAFGLEVIVQIIF